MGRSFWIETLGCPKNQVDSEKLLGLLRGSGLTPAAAADRADVVVVNTCAFVEEARAESVETILALSATRAPGAEVVVTGCLAERAGDELAAAIPEVDLVAGFGRMPLPELATAAPVAARSAVATPPVATPPVAEPIPRPDGASTAVPVRLGERRARGDRSSEQGADDPSGGRADDPSDPPAFDLLRLPRPAATAPWAYLKIAEGCDRACGFCAIPSFRGPQRSRPVDELVEEVAGLDVREVVLVAQDLAAYGRDQGRGERAIIPLLRRLRPMVDRVRLLYLYPSDLSGALIEEILATDVPYFDLSLQHVSPPLLRRMRRWGSGDRFLERIERIRAAAPDAAFRSNFIVGYPGETEEDHDELLAFVAAARLDWCGFFAYSEEAGTLAAGQHPKVPAALAAERLAELRELQDAITAARRDELIGRRLRVLVDEAGVARSVREAPEIDGVVHVRDDLPVGALVDVDITAALGPDLVAGAEGDIDPWVRTSLR